MSDVKNYKPVMRTQSEMQALHMRLMNFLLNCNGDYTFVETGDGVLIGISPIKYEESGALVGTEKKGIIT